MKFLDDNLEFKEGSNTFNSQELLTKQFNFPGPNLELSSDGLHAIFYDSYAGYLIAYNIPEACIVTEFKFNHKEVS